MGQLVPADFPMEQLANDAERNVVGALVEQLYDSWLIVPDLGMRSETRDHETDIVLVHPDMGVLIIEVKGHRVGIREGMWIGNEGTALDPQPLKQAQDNSHQLKRRIRREVEGLEHLDIGIGLAFPNTKAIDGQLTMDIADDQILLASDLLDANDAVERMAHLGPWRNQALTPAQIEGIIGLIRPDADFVWDPDARTKATKQRLDELCDAQITALGSLAQNRRVFVRGGAGTGKTRLGMMWARRAWAEDDRVLLTCFNDPLAQSLRDEFGFIDDDRLVVGAFLRMVLELPGMPELEVPSDANAVWWDTVATGHFIKYWPQVDASFDTIIIDEAQDFSPAWIALLEALLDPEGRRRMLVLADEGQGIFERGFVFPQQGEGWTHAELGNNFRNALPIARVLRRGLGGAASPASSPEGLGVTWHAAGDVELLAELVQVELDRILDDEGRNASGVCVATFRSAVRDHLRGKLDLVSWENRGGGAVLCENVHRLKGLEFDTMILAAIDDVEDVAVLYVGVSRAVSELVLLGPPELADRLGLA